VSKLFVISAPSGSGKTTLCKRLLDDKLGLANSISMTTRPPRPGEKNGEDYHFVSEELFKKTIEENGFLEYEENFGSFYGTPKKFVEDNLKITRPVLLSIDVKGAMKVRIAYPAESVLIFILPPSVKDLKARLNDRRSDKPEDIARRLRIAEKEMAYKDRYDYRIVNDNLDQAYKELKKVIISELEEDKCRRK
jgi:guanylate kinase